MKLTSARLAWRNLWRHAQRTILMIAIVAFGSLVILTVWGITDGFMRTMTDAQARYDLGDLQLRAVGYADDRVPTNGLDATEASAVSTLLEGFPGIVATPRLDAGGMLSSAYGSDGILIRGIDPIMEPEVTSLQEGLAEGRYVAARGEVMLSSRMAERLDIHELLTIPLHEPAFALLPGDDHLEMGSRAQVPPHLEQHDVVELVAFFPPGAPEIGEFRRVVRIGKEATAPRGLRVVRDTKAGRQFHLGLSTAT